MPTNNQIILDQVLQQKRAEVAPEKNDSSFFELFVAEQILKDYELAYDEIQAGIVGNGGDGGIDAVYLFINGELVREDTLLRSIRGSVSIEIHLIQAKVGRSFSDTAIQRLRSSIEDLFNLANNLSDLRKAYNEDLLDIINRFRQIHEMYVSRMPEVRFCFYYATKADDLNIHPNVERLVLPFKQQVIRMFSSADISFEFLGARELLELARRSPRTTYPLDLAENPISTQNVSFICLVNLVEYFRFITDDRGRFNRSIFEANVRDYQGDVQVNQKIQETLQNPQGEDFWWLNNGITIVASRATLSGKSLTVEAPQIVNGLQTSSEVYKFLNSSADRTKNDDRNILVRVIVPETPSSLDRIIQATNSQTVIPAVSLRATDKIHRDIEDYLKPHGYYYDRKKNYYKNEGRPLKSIISIGYLGQAQMSIVLRRPDNARARPSTVIRDENDYRQVFSADYPLELYLRSIEITNRATEYLRAKGLSRNDVNNLRFHLAMYSALRLANDPTPGPNKLAKLDVSELTDSVMDEYFEPVHSAFRNLGGTDLAAKGPEFRNALLEILNQSTYRGHLTDR